MAVSLVVAGFESDHDARLYFISLFFVIVIVRWVPLPSLYLNFTLALALPSTSPSTST